MVYIVFCSDIDGPAHHGHGDITGATTATVGRCQVGTCHGSNNPSNIVMLQVLDTTTMLPITTYRANHTYLVSLKGDATAISTDLPGFGFQVSAVLANHTLAGSYTIPSASASSIHTYVCGATTVVEHSATLRQDTSGVNKYSIQFYWTAPAPFTDSVSFFALLNAVNGDGGKTGDYPNAAPIVTIYEDAADNVAILNYSGNDFSFYPNPASTNLKIKGTTKITSAVIYDVAGRAVFSAEYNNTEVDINIAGLLPGSYIVRVNGFSTSQFAKQ
jgi:hypothetical protein